METGKNNTNSKSRGKFKSYYVVWKLIYSFLFRYYSFEFKSYYVVWKLLSCYYYIITIISLNRTM